MTKFEQKVLEKVEQGTNKLKGQVCLLTGATGGIGGAIAKQLAEQGVTLILQGRNLVALNTLVEQLPGEHIVIAADLADNQQRADLVKEVKNFARLTMLINNAGVSDFGEFGELSAEQISRNLSVNLNLPILLTHELLPVLMAQPQATIVNIGSTFGSIGFPGFSAYCASKFGLRGFTESLQRELINSQVRVCYFAPRTTKTGINSTVVNQLNQSLGNQEDSPNQVAKALVKLLQSNRKRAFIGWPEKLFARINGLLPELVDSALAKKLPTVLKFARQGQSA